MTDTAAEWRFLIAINLITATPSCQTRVLNSVLHCCKQTNLYAWLNKIPLPRTTANRIYTLCLVKCSCKVTVVSRVSSRATEVVCTPNKLTEVLSKYNVTNLCHCCSAWFNNSKVKCLALDRVSNSLICKILNYKPVAGILIQTRELKLREAICKILPDWLIWLSLPRYNKV